MGAEDVETREGGSASGPSRSRPPGCPPDPANISRGRGPKSPSPAVPLPHWRIPVPKQLEILRGHVAASNNGTKPVSNTDLASVVGMHVNNVCLPNPFFAVIGLIHRRD